MRVAEGVIGPQQFPHLRVDLIQCCSLRHPRPQTPKPQPLDLKHFDSSERPSKITKYPSSQVQQKQIQSEKSRNHHVVIFQFRQNIAHISGY